MTMLFMDSFDHYGVGAAPGGTLNPAADDHMLDGVWAQIDNRDGSAGDYDALQSPSFGARTGNVCMYVGRSATYRLVLPAAKTTIVMGLGIYFPALPNANGDSYISFRDSGNSDLCSLMVNADGSLSLVTGASIGSPIVSSQGPVLTAGTWHHLEMKITFDASGGVFKVILDGATTVINSTSLNTGASDVAQIAFKQSVIDGLPIWYFDDLVIMDTAGSVNNDFIGDVRVATLVASQDGTVGWTPRWRKNLGNGILNLDAALVDDTDPMISAADSAEFEFGSGDYTVEGFFRFHATSTVTRQLIGKWQESGSAREWTLELTGDGDTLPNRLQLRVSTDGATPTTIHTWPFVPLLFKWYHIAVSRASSVNYLFVDGVMQGVGRADSNTYNAGAAALGIGARMSSSTAVVATTGLNGMMDELRITKGVGRYTANFTAPTTEFGRDVGGDASFASVSLLAGFNDLAITDESGTGHTLTARNSAAALQPDDGDGAYDTINQLSPRDDTVIEALLAPALSILTVGSNPGDTETVTIGSQAYTFKTTLSGSSFEVFIGATYTDTLDNLVAAINDAGGEGTAYGTGTTANTDVSATRLPDPQIMITALTAGTDGNSIATTETLTDGSWTDTTMAGGVDIPGSSSFTLSRLPPLTTQVKAIQVMTRAYKTDAGTATIKTTLVGPSAGTSAGSSKPLTTDPTYRWDIFETDPDTSGAITPPTLANGQIKINRES